MRSKLVLLLLATLQASHASHWDRPHVRCYSREVRNADSCERQSSEEHFEEHHAPLNCDGLSRPHHFNRHTPIHDEYVPVRRNTFSRDDANEETAQPLLHSRQCWKGSRGHEDGGILVNPLRPPYPGSVNNMQNVELSPPHVNHCENQASSEVGGVLSDLKSPSYVGASLPNVATSPRLCAAGEGINSVGASVSSGAVNSQLGAWGISSESELLSAAGMTKFSPFQAFLPPGIFPSNQPIRGPASLSGGLPSVPSFPAVSLPNVCVRHRLVPVPVRVVEDCITNVPVVRKFVHSKVETVTNHIPVEERLITHQSEKVVRHVPVTGRTLRNVVESRIRHIPVIRSRTRTVVEPYTEHIPVTVRFTRPVEESITKTIPVREVRIRPVVTKTTRLVPVVERRLRPIVEQRIDHIPVRRQYLRTVVEQRVRPVVVPCRPCQNGPLPPIDFPLSATGDILSPYSNLVRPSSGGPFSSELGGPLSRGPAISLENAFLPEASSGSVDSGGIFHGPSSYNHGPSFRHHINSGASCQVSSDVAFGDSSDRDISSRGPLIIPSHQGTDCHHH